MALQLRRGTNKERLQITPAEGELIFVTDWELVQITGTSIDGGSETITFSADHGLAVGDQVLFQSSTQLGLTQNTVYYVISPGLTTTACRLATSSGGAAINLTGGTGLTLTFAKTPTDAAGTPIGTNVTALWIGDGSTPGGIPGNTQGLNDLTDVEITTPNEGQTLYYDATTALWKNTSILEVNDTSNRIEVAGDIHATGDLTLNSDLGPNDVTIQFTSGRTLKWDHGDQRYEFNTGDLYLTSDLIVGGDDIKNSSGTTIITFSGNNTVLSGDLEVQGQEIKSNGGTTAITLSGANVTVAGNLTVNGSTTTVNSTTLTVDDKNIELASTATPSDTTADGGGITLKGSTDKKIIWNNSNGRWSIDNGDGNQYVIPINIDDLADVVVSSPNKGQLLYYNGSEWVNASIIQFDSILYRPRFQNNNSATPGTIQSALLAVKNTGSSSYTSGDGSGILIGVVDNTSPTPSVFAGLSAVYNSGGGHQIRLRTSSNNFSTENILLSVDNEDLKLKGTELVFNAEGTGAAAVDAQITVERGTSSVSDAYIKWNEDPTTPSNSRWVASNEFKSEGNITADQSLIANGDLYLNNDGGTNDVLINFKVGPTPTNQTLKWVESPGRFEFTTDLYVPMATIGNIDIDRTNGQIDTNSGFNLTLDSDGGNVLINDNLNVDSGVLFVDAANNRVGINDITPSYPLDVTGDIRSTTSVITPEVELNSAATLDAFTTTKTSTSQFTLAETTGDVLKVIIHMSLGTQRHCVEALAMKYGASTAGLTTYAELNTVAGGAPIANFAADVSSGSLRILATPTSSSTTTFKVVRTQIA